MARGVVGDITDEELLRTAGIDTCDTVVVATGENLESSVLAVMHCKSLGVPRVIAKVKSQTAKKVLEKIGADSVISPEYEMGQSLAQTILFHNNVDVFQLDKKCLYRGDENSECLGRSKPEPARSTWQIQPQCSRIP